MLYEQYFIHLFALGGEFLRKIDNGENTCRRLKNRLTGICLCILQALLSRLDLAFRL